MSHQDTATGQDVTNGATGGTIANARATQTKYRSSQRKKRDYFMISLTKRRNGATTYFAPAGDTATDKETDGDDETVHAPHTDNPIDQQPPPFSASTNVGSWGGDKID
eukprot:13562379-Ditylum_brightwellii.AAC.1